MVTLVPYEFVYRYPIRELQEKALHIIINNDDILEYAPLLQYLQILDVYFIFHGVETVLQTQNVVEVTFVTRFFYCFSESLSIGSSSTSIQNDFEILPEDIQHLE